MSVLSSRLAPGFVRLRYSGETQPHNQIIPIKFAATPTPGVEPSLATSDESDVLFNTAIENYVTAALAGSFDVDTSFGFADIYSVSPTTGLRTFIFTHNLGEPGSAVTANVPLVEGVFVFKTTAGKPLKVYTMEGVYAADARSIGDVPNDGRQDMVDYILSGANIFYGRTDSWPLAFMSFTSKVNDVLRRRDGFGGV